MIPSLIILAALLLVGTVLYIHHRLSEKPESHRASASPESPEAPGNPENYGSSEQSDSPDDPDSGVCCGLHAVCEKGLRTEPDPALDYYDDDELDAFAGRAADTYNDDEIDSFRNVMLTLIPADVAPWHNALARRGIAFPTALRDELLMLIAEQAAQPTASK